MPPQGGMAFARLHKKNEAGSSMRREGRRAMPDMLRYWANRNEGGIPAVCGLWNSSDFSLLASE